MAASTNFTFDDAIQAVREQLNDDAQRRWTDTDILNLTLPRVYQQLYSDRPDLFFGSYGTVNFKPSVSDAIPFDDVGFNALVEAILAALSEQAEESNGPGQAQGADSRSERARRS